MATGQRWQEIQSLFARAVDLDPAVQARWLDEACHGDQALRDEVAALLQAERRAGEGSFIADVIGRAAQDLALDAVPSRVGERVGPYRLVREIGHGGMGAVYLAERADDQYHAQVAIKFVRHAAAAGELERRLRAERQILAGLTHQNIARLLDGGSAPDGTPYLVMEFVDGEPIDAWCDDHGLGLDGRLALFQRVCAAVQHAHQGLVVHRDLKPSNILVTAGGTPKLVDFGIAKLLAEGEAEATGTMRVFTPAYGSPEQARGAHVTVATDIYSLGAVLYALLTGRPPLELGNASPAEIERRLADEVPPAPSAVTSRAWRRRLRGDLDTIVLKALRKEPERRYASVEQLSDDLRRHLEGRPVSARPDTLAYRAGRFVSRHRFGVGATVVLVGLTAVYTWRLAGERNRARTEATKAAAVAEFLTRLFEVSDPSQSRGQSVTARELLDQGARRIDSSLADQPEVQAAIMRVIGEVYGTLGLRDAARPLLLGALEKFRTFYGDEHDEVAASLVAVGALLQNSGDAAAAESSFREALAIRQRLDPSNDLGIAPVESRLAFLLEGAGRFEEAERLYRSALARQRRTRPPDHPDIAANLVRLGGLLRQTDRLDEAEPLLREAVVVQRSQYGRVHPRVASAYRNLAALRRDQGDFEEADSLYREAIAIRRELYGDTHQDVATTLHSYGLLLQRKGDHERALATFVEAVTLLERIYPNGHSNLAIGYYDLASELRDQGRYDEAAARFRQAIRLDDRFLAVTHRDRGQSRLALASVLMAQGRFTEAEPVLRASLAMRREAVGPDHRYARDTESELGACLTALGRYREAESLLRPAYDALLKSEGPTDARTLRARERLAALYAAWGRPADAAQYRATGIVSPTKQDLLR